ncbi:MAG: DUF4198 domain-containing protein [Deltaproteobacteria bacterium]|nr:DUF4198 domain-containing protein [Deltaproteobacteria bacterium]
MKKPGLTGSLFLLGLFAAGLASAHFGMIIPSKDVIGKDDPKEVALQILFAHPFEGRIMQMDRPARFGVVADGKVTDLLGTLAEAKVDGKSTWKASFKIAAPADYIFFVVPQPYWEPAEEKFIIHVTKVIVDALGAESGWDQPVAQLAGLPCEIVPMTRPYSLYAGNIFTGQVFKHGKPAPNAEVEVEFWGKGRTKAPTDAHVAQLVKADQNGVFSFAMPKSGWWGFAALMEGSETIKKDGADKKVELGAVLWVHAYPWQ